MDILFLIGQSLVNIFESLLVEERAEILTMIMLFFGRPKGVFIKSFQFSLTISGHFFFKLGKV